MLNELRVQKVAESRFSHRRGQSLYIRPLIIGTEDLDVRPAQRFKFIIMSAPARAYFQHGAEGIALQVQQRFTRAAPGGTGFAKTGGNYAASLLPGELSRRAGYHQALWLDGIEHRYAEEVGQIGYGERDYAIGGGVCGPLTRELYQAITAIQYGETTDPYGWTEIVEPEPAATAA